MTDSSPSLAHSDTPLCRTKQRMPRALNSLLTLVRARGAAHKTSEVRVEVHERAQWVADIGAGRIGSDEITSIREVMDIEVNAP
jgi:hypothetical protein